MLSIQICELALKPPSSAARPVFGMFIGAAGQGEFSDRWGRKISLPVQPAAVRRFHHPRCSRADCFLLWSAALSRGFGLGGEQPLAFAYAGEYSPKRSADASSQSCISSAAPASGRSAPRWCFCLALIFRDLARSVWRGVWIVIGIGALIVWVFRFSLPESPRYLATHGRGKEALDVLDRDWEFRTGRTEQLTTSAASNTKS